MQHFIMSMAYLDLFDTVPCYAAICLSILLSVCPVPPAQSEMDCNISLLN